MKTYIGVHPKGKGSNGNEGLIFVDQEDGTYICQSLQVGLSHSSIGHRFTISQIEHDIRLGYLKEHVPHETKPGINSEVFKLKFDKGWMEGQVLEAGIDLVVGEDIEFIGEPKQEGDYMVHSFKALSEKAKKLFIAE